MDASEGRNVGIELGVEVLVPAEEDAKEYRN